MIQNKYFYKMKGNEVMELKELEVTLTDALQNSENDESKVKYADAITAYLKEHKSSNEIITIVVRGMDIDRAANYFDHLERLSKNDLQSVWKQIKDNKEIMSNSNYNGLKFISGMLGLSFMKVGNIESYTGNLAAKIVSIVCNEKHAIAFSSYKPIVLDYFVDEIDKMQLQNYPKWETLKKSGGICKQFAELLLNITDDEKGDKYNTIRKWASIGISFSEKLIEKERIEAKIPKSKISDLYEIAEHYKGVEKQVREDEYEIARLEGIITGLQEEINKLSLENKNLKNDISNLQENIEDQKKDMEKAEKEIDKRKEINDTFSALKKKDEEGLLNDIAEDLKLTYKQVKGSEKTEMSVELGEIYREMIKKIFKILDKKGIRME